MSAHLELLVLCTWHPLSAGERERLRALAAETTDWDTFATLAELNKVEPKVCLALTQAGALEAVPEPVRGRLQTAAGKVKRANAQRLERARELFPVLVEAGIRVCVLKGVLFAETVYGEPGYKRMNDVDFLVPRAQIDLLPALYERLGYFSISERVGHRPEVQTRVSHHLAPYVSRDLRCVLGTQWGLKSPLLGLHIDYEAMWSRTRPFDFYGTPLRQLSPADNLFHVCVHLGLFKAGLRDVMDIYNLARVAGAELDYALFTRLVRDAGAEDLAFHALSLAQRLCPSADFARVLAQLEPKVSAFMRRTVATKTRELAMLLQLCTGYLGVIEKAITDFNASDSAAQKLRGYAHFWRLVARPSPEEARRVCFAPDPAGPSAWSVPFRAPVAILRGIGAEIGLPLLGLLLLKGTVDTALTALNPLAWRRSGQRDLATFAHRHGISLTELQRLKDSIF